jgi:CheY-like chemotaxis protein
VPVPSPGSQRPAGLTQQRIQRPPAMKTSRPTILLIDDDPNDLMFLRAAFKAAGHPFEIQSVNSGYEALAYLNGDAPYADRRQTPYPDLILTDLNMPGLDGFGVLEFLRKKPAFVVIPTIVLSGSQDNDDIRRSYLLGASAYHVKPSSPLELRRLIKTLCDYWSLCEKPEKTPHGEQLGSESLHKLGERYAADDALSRPGGSP